MNSSKPNDGVGPITKHISTCLFDWNPSTKKRAEIIIFSPLTPHIVSTSYFPLRTIGALYNCFILVSNHLKCTSIWLELSHANRKNDCESDILAIEVTELILDSSMQRMVNHWKRSSQISFHCKMLRLAVMGQELELKTLDNMDLCLQRSELYVQKVKNPTKKRWNV